MSKRRRTASQRCECKAKITLKYCGDTGFTVFAFTEEHNHPLADEETKKFLRCNRQLTFGDKNFSYDASKVNIGPKRSFSVLKEFVGSYENIGATATEFKNFGRDLKARIGEHDADMILDKFKRMKEQSNGSFYYEYKVDSAGHLTGLFWVDATGRRNYTVFGDALSFDPTYRTNRYNMVFVLFTGVDNHWHNVTFAAALLEKEDHHNFMWALKAFEKTMDHIPKCVITDQDNAISKALELVWKDTCHRFCMWHIMNKLPGKVRPSLASDKKFMGKMKSLVWADHLTINEFEEGWNSVIEEYDLQDNTWLNNLYNIRADWIPAFFNDLEMAGLLRTTSRSESSNFYFQHFQQSGDTLVQFYSRYESAMDKQRYTNSQNKKDSQLIPKPYLQLPIEKDAGVVYTRQLFNFVQEEIVSGFLHTHIGDMNVVDGMKFFQIVDRLLNERVFEVSVRLCDYHIHCSCNFYLRTGYLCKHAFAALHQCRVSQIPREFVKNRWTKNAEQLYCLIGQQEVVEHCASLNRTKLKHGEMWFDFRSCISHVGTDEVKVDKMHERVKKLKADTCDIESDNANQGRHAETDMILGCTPQGPVVIHNPNISRNKGCGSRIKSGKEISMNDKQRICRRCGKKEGHNAGSCPQGKK